MEKLKKEEKKERKEGNKVNKREAVSAVLLEVKYFLDDSADTFTPNCSGKQTNYPRSKNHFLPI